MERLSIYLGNYQPNSSVILFLLLLSQVAFLLCDLLGIGPLEAIKEEEQYLILSEIASLLGAVFSALHAFSHLITSRRSYYPHLPDGRTEAWKGLSSLCQVSRVVSNKAEIQTLRL